MFDHRIEFNTGITEIAVRSNALAEAGELLRHACALPAGARIVLVSDKRVAALHGQRLSEALRQVGFNVLEHLVEPGEKSKSLEAAGDLYRFLAQNTVPRDTAIVALGGGVVSDLAGFVAATWMRGVRFVVCPTTLESAIDASIGGKTAINLPEAKNLIGAFHQPVLVVIDPSCLDTLEVRDVSAGLGESVKHALIASEEFLAWHECHADAILGLDDSLTVELILRNVQIKSGIVEEDEREQTGRRVLLNFGHTIGHAIEACCGFTLRHGECVALGMTAACHLSHTMGILDRAVVARVEAILHRFGLPTSLAEPIDSDLIMTALRHDKKIHSGATHFVLLEGPGRPVVRNGVSDQAILEAYESLCP